jgi:CubicO group peptidase (beta-lactamase class C family)
VLWTAGFGVANVDSGLLVQADTPFMLASVSKTVTGVAVMHAIESGHLSLTGDLADVLPFPIDNPLVAREVITLSHLVTHTSGIRDNWANMPYADGDSPYALGEYLEGYLVEGGDWYSAADNFYDVRPGREWNYGNIATALAGYTVEVGTATPFDDYCEAHIFDVLGMDDTGWHLADFDPDTVAMPTEYIDGVFVSTGHYGYADYPDGQLRSSAADMGRFLAAMSNEGALDDATVLQPETMDDLFTSHEPGGGPDQYVFWYRSDADGRSVIGHGGNDIGVTTSIAFEPDTGIGVVLLTNAGGLSVGDVPGEVSQLLFAHAESL